MSSSNGDKPFLPDSLPDWARCWVLRQPHFSGGHTSNGRSKPPSGPDPARSSVKKAASRSTSSHSGTVGSTAALASSQGPDVPLAKQKLATAVAHAIACNGHPDLPAASDATAGSATDVGNMDDIGGWDVASWLGDRVIAPVASALISPLGGQGVHSQVALSFVHTLGSLVPHECRDVVREVLSTSSLLDTLAEVISAAVAELAAEAAGAETKSAVHQLSNKFAVDSFTLSFSGLSSFFSGLEGRLGPPDPKLMEAMESEHRRSADSQEAFISSNYGISTTSETEWLYVVDPDGGMAHLGIDSWPSEQHSIEWEHKRQHRNASPLAAFEAARHDVNRQFRAMEEPPLMLEELIGARMYTGCARPHSYSPRAQHVHQHVHTPCIPRAHPCTPRAQHVHQHVHTPCIPRAHSYSPRAQHVHQHVHTPCIPHAHPCTPRRRAAGTCTPHLVHTSLTSPHLSSDLPPPCTSCTRPWRLHLCRAA